MLQIGNILYFFDRVRFNVYFDRNHLLSVPELKDLNRRHVVDVFDAYEKAKKRGYNTRIEVTAPTNEVLDVIEKAISECRMSVNKFRSLENEKFYSISMIEPTRDFIKDTESKANLLADRLMSVSGKKYTAKFIIYDAENDPRINRKKNDPKLKEEIFSTRTGYWGNRNSFEYVVYGRRSKICKLPATHTELRILGSYNIKKRTGIKSISDMKNFDFQKFFEENDKKYLVYEAINYNAIGRWHLGIDGRRKLKGRVKKREAISIGIAGVLFCNCNKLDLPCKQKCNKNHCELDDDCKPDSPCRQKCQNNKCQSLACELRSAAALKHFLDVNKGKIKNVNGKVLGHEKSNFFTRESITIYSLL
jgi:hypothetical protein